MCRTDLCARLHGTTFLLVSRELDNGSCGTNIRAASTFRSAEATLVTACRHHHMHKVIAWTKHIVRAFRDTKLTSCTFLLHVLQANGSRRTNRLFSIRTFLSCNCGQSSIGSFLLSLGKRGTKHRSSSSKECAACWTISIV